MKKRGPKAYNEEFRQHALRLVETGDKPLAQLARELGVHLETLRGWKRLAQARGEIGKPPTMATVAEENRRLRRENARLLEERDILKKATAFFAKDGR
ncbi:MAG TPA: transposase [Gemmatimonadaceae bacterium]|nr:transposase [Gemmatimonadaceae bacterium]